MENMSVNVTRRSLCSYFVIAFDVLCMPAVLCGQAPAGTCRHIQSRSDASRHMQVHAGACRHIYRHMQTHADTLYQARNYLSIMARLIGRLRQENR